MAIGHGDSFPTCEDGTENGHCEVCGRRLRDGRLFVEVVDGGSVHDPATGPADVHDPGYLGFFPVGPECAKRFEPGIAVSFAAAGWNKSTGGSD
jgi:hypothetical protein